MDFKISLAIAFLLSLTIPFLIKPINGLYDIDELNGLKAYCFLHADRAAQGENVVNDLIKSGLANSTYYDWSCSKISEEIEAESQRLSEAKRAETELQKAYAYDCKYGNLTPSEYWKCDHAGYSPEGIICLFEEDREEAKKRLAEGGYIPGRLDFKGTELSLERTQTHPLTPAEQSECRETGHLPIREEEQEREQED